MPTPFTHLAAAQRLLADDALAPSLRVLLETERPAFLLGSVAADAHPPGGRREDTHFYTYDRPLTESPWRVMLRRHPTLQPARSPAHRAFLAGYVAHLAMDEIWTRHMLAPHFALGEWGTRGFRFLMLHALLITMDERDLMLLEPWQHPALAAAQPDEWLPFLPDSTLSDWRNFIAEQIKPGGASQTLQVFGARINKTPDELRLILDSPEQMHLLWENVTPAILADIEAQMYNHAREQMGLYLDGE
ncbi:MAG: zinc dependent phospholipase C family protein [Chloroflexi bacterium]|nr:zinc dependent phospholipase C family protein [Chloroflexota bacterium]